MDIALGVMNLIHQQTNLLTNQPVSLISEQSVPIFQERLEMGSLCFARLEDIEMKYTYLG